MDRSGPERIPNSLEATTPIVKKGKIDSLCNLAKKYLTTYGYMSACDCRDDMLCKHVSSAMKHFQHFCRLKPTGTLTLETLRIMRHRRCPVPDFGPGAVGGPGIADSDPFVFSDNTWDRSDLRWFLLSGTSDMTGEADTIQQAFDVWAAHIPLSFTRTFTQTDADFTVSWEVGDHGDGFPFDGSGSGGFNVFAHAFFPRDGRIHFDDAERWGTTDAGDREDLLTTAIHEIGHALGLRHSGDSDAVMFFEINGVQHELHEFDIRGIKSRYPSTLHTNASDFVTVPLWGLKSSGGTGTRTIDLGRSRRILAWGQVTMVDPLNDFDRDNGYAVEVFDVDGIRHGPLISGGDHWGSTNAPSNVHHGAWIGNARRVTFRISALHTSDLDVFGTGNIIIIN